MDKRILFIYISLNELTIKSIRLGNLKDLQVHGRLKDFWDSPVCQRYLTKNYHVYAEIWNTTLQSLPVNLARRNLFVHTTFLSLRDIVRKPCSRKPYFIILTKSLTNSSNKAHRTNKYCLVKTLFYRFVRDRDLKFSELRKEKNLKKRRKTIIEEIPE